MLIAASLFDQERGRRLSPAGSCEGLSVSEACRVAGIGRTKIYEAISDGRLKARKFGKRTLVLRADLQDFLTQLPVVRADA